MDYTEVMVDVVLGFPHRAEVLGFPHILMGVDLTTQVMSWFFKGFPCRYEYGVAKVTWT